MSKNVKLDPYDRFLPQISIHNCGRLTLAEWMVPMQALPLWHIYWNPTAGGKLILPKEEIEMQSDTIYLLPSYLMFAAGSMAPFEHCFLDFFMRSELFSQVKKEVITFPLAEYRSILERCFREKISALAAEALIFLLLDGLPRTCFVQEKKHTIDPRIRQALDLIFKTFRSDGMKKLDNCKLSRAVGMSLVNFQHLFKREMQISPHRYCLNLRLEAAHDLLKNSSKSIEEIALISGFANRYQFSKSFTLLYGIPPGKLRKNCRNLREDLYFRNRRIK